MQYRYSVKDKAVERSKQKWLKEMREKQACSIPVTILAKRLIPIKDR